MKRLVLFFLLLALTGCNEKAVPVNIKFPAVPQDLLVACPDLKLVDPKTTQLSDVLDVVTDNYATYYECKVKIDDWITWYNTQKAIFDRITQ